MELDWKKEVRFSGHPVLDFDCNDFIYRWGATVLDSADFHKQWKKFKPKHPGGTRYDITKMSKAQKQRYSLNNKEPFW